MLQQLGLDEPGARERSSPSGSSSSRRSGSASASRTRRWRARSRRSPEFQDHGRFIGKDEIRRRLELAGPDRGRSSRGRCGSRLERESLEGLIGAGRRPSDAEVEREFRRRTEQVRLEYVLADAARYRAARRSRPRTRSRRASRRSARRTGFPEKRVVSYVLLDRATLQPQVAVTDRELELYYQDHREEFRQDEEACASHILVKVKQGDAGEGHTDAEARAIAQKLLDQLKAGARLRRAREEVLGGHGLGRSRAATSAASRRAAWCRSSTTRSSRSQPGSLERARQDLLRLPRDPPRLEARGDGAAVRRRSRSASARASPRRRRASSASRRPRRSPRRSPRASRSRTPPRRRASRSRRAPPSRAARRRRCCSRRAWWRASSR